MSDDLPPRLAALISGEREAPTGDRRRVRAQLSASLGIAAAGSTAAAASAIASKLVVLALAVGVVGGGAAIVVHERRTATVPATAIATIVEPGAAMATESAAAAPTATVSVPAPAPVGARLPISGPPPVPRLGAVAIHTASRAAVVVPAPAAVAVGEPAAAPRSSTTAIATSRDDQRALLALAWSALSRGDNSGALSVLDQDASHHPSAPLTEERDALHIETLRRLGRASDADREARAFLARFPDSIHRPLVAQALVKESP